MAGLVDRIKLDEKRQVTLLVSDIVPIPEPSSRPNALSSKYVVTVRAYGEQATLMFNELFMFTAATIREPGTSRLTSVPLSDKVPTGDFLKRYSSMIVDALANMYNVQAQGLQARLESAPPAGVETTRDFHKVLYNLTAPHYADLEVVGRLAAKIATRSVRHSAA